MKKEFKLHDKVFDILFGWGIVEQQRYQKNYDLRVKFKDTSRLYTTDGRYLTDANPTLSHTEYNMESNEFPKVMEVRMNSRDKWIKRCVIAIKRDGAVAWHENPNSPDFEDEISTSVWDYCREISEIEELVELTFQEISEGKGVGIAPHLIRIKKS